VTNQKLVELTNYWLLFVFCACSRFRLCKLYFYIL